MKLLLLILSLAPFCMGDPRWSTNVNSLNVQTILKNNHQPNRLKAHSKHFKGETLAYVTPWNNRGYDIVKEFKGKFDYVSPVWYYIQRRSPKQFDFDGEHDVDLGWMAEVKDKEAKKGWIVPRFQFRGWTGEDLRDFVSSKEESELLAKQIQHQVDQYGFDGIVLECGYPAYFQYFLSQLSSGLHAKGQRLVVVLPSLLSDQHRQIMTAEAFEGMAQYVDKFSLMTYDYSSHDPHGGPSAPIEWIMDNIESMTTESNRHKLMVGLNMYAVSYLLTRTPEPLVMKTVVEKLSVPRQDELFMEGDPVDENEELNWDKESQEAWFIDYDEDGIKQGIVWMPTLRSIKNRIRLAEDYGVGLALWEVGQGLDYFYDLFNP